MTEIDQMLMSILRCRWVDLYLQEPTLTDEQQSVISKWNALRAQGVPLQYILGNTQFMDATINVDERVLIPRPETECMVDFALNELSRVDAKNLQVLDLGTGSGNISIALAMGLSNVNITAIDISSEALDLARYNATVNSVENRIDFIHADMNKWLETSSRKFDFVVSNPPYIPTKDISNLALEIKREPLLALEGGVDGLAFYKNIARIVKRVLRDNSQIVLEFGDGQASAIQKLFNDSNFLNVSIHCDLTGRERFLHAFSK